MNRQMGFPRLSGLLEEVTVRDTDGVANLGPTWRCLNGCSHGMNIAGFQLQMIQTDSRGASTC